MAWKTVDLQEQRVRFVVCARRALAGEWVQLERIEHRVLVYYCRSLVREPDLPEHQSTALDRWST